MDSVEAIAAANEEAIEAWDGPLFDSFVRFRHLLTSGLGVHGEERPRMLRAQTITERFVTKPEEYDEPTCGPGPFSMANADTTSGILLSAGFEDVSLLRCDRPIIIGRDLDEAVDLVMSLGPAGEILRLAGERAEHLHEPVAEALREGLADWAGPDGVIAPASTWIVAAQAPLQAGAQPE